MSYNGFVSPFNRKFASVIAIRKISNLEIKADDISELIVHHKNGVVSSIHTDIFGRQHKKGIEIKVNLGNIWDFYKNEVTVYASKDKKVEIYDQFNGDFNECYIEELKTFIETFTKKNSLIPLEHGIDTMKLILASERSEKSKRRTSLIK